MKKTLLIALFGVLLGLGAGYRFFHTPAGPGGAAAGGEKAGQKKIAYWVDPMHPWYTSDKPGKAPDCGMDLVPVYEGEKGVTDDKGVRIDPAVVQNIGVKTEEVALHNLSRTVRAPGRVTVDEKRIFSVNTKISGWVEELFVDFTGMTVRKGQPLMTLYSPELVTAQEEYLQAARYRDRLKADGDPVAVRGAEQLLQSARTRLLNWDITPSEIQELENRGTAARTMTINSPAGGVVMEKKVAKGQNAAAGTDLYTIADLSTVWVDADIFQHELSWAKIGQAAAVEISYLPGKTFAGRVSFIYPTLDEERKTARVRIELPNGPGLELKPGMFATVVIQTPALRNVVAVPEQAIIRSGTRMIAVMDRGGGYFDPREVKLGISADGFVQVLEGIHEGEKIVVSSQFLIDSESNLKSAVGLMAMPGMPMPGSAGGGKAVQEQVPPSGGGMPGMSEHDMQNMPDSSMKSIPAQPKQKSAKPAKQLYTCEMHPEVISDKPGNCPKCGMKLVPKK